MCLNTQFRDNIQVSVDFPSVSPPASTNDCASVGPLSVNPIFLEVSSGISFGQLGVTCIDSSFILYNKLTLYGNRSWLITARNETGARLCFYTCLLSVILFTGGGWYPSMHCRWYPSFAAGLGRGGVRWYPSMPCRSPGHTQGGS